MINRLYNHTYRNMLQQFVFILALIASVNPVAHTAIVGGDFQLKRVDGQLFDLKQHRGKTVILTFGYTYCPHICSPNLSLISQTLKQLGPDADQVMPVFISVDPQRDTPAVLKNYLQNFHSALVGLTDSETKLSAVAKQYGSFIRFLGDRNAGTYEIDHSGNIYIIDKQGKLARIVPFGMPLELLVKNVKEVHHNP